MTLRNFAIGACNFLSLIGRIGILGIIAYGAYTGFLGGVIALGFWPLALGLAGGFMLSVALQVGGRWAAKKLADGDPNNVFDKDPNKIAKINDRNASHDPHIQHQTSAGPSTPTKSITETPGKVVAFQPSSKGSVSGFLSRLFFHQRTNVEDKKTTAANTAKVITIVSRAQTQ